MVGWGEGVNKMEFFREEKHPFGIWGGIDIGRCWEVGCGEWCEECGRGRKNKAEGVGCVSECVSGSCEVMKCR